MILLFISYGISSVFYWTNMQGGHVLNILNYYSEFNILEFFVIISVFFYDCNSRILPPPPFLKVIDARFFSSIITSSETNLWDQWRILLFALTTNLIRPLLKTLANSKKLIKLKKCWIIIFLSCAVTLFL